MAKKGYNIRRELRFVQRPADQEPIIDYYTGEESGWSEGMVERIRTEGHVHSDSFDPDCDPIADYYWVGPEESS